MCRAADATAPLARSSALDQMADGGNAFALNLYGQLRASGGNLFFSPYSVQAALMMVRAGAAGSTADEISKTLQLPNLNSADLNGAVAGLTARYGSTAPDKGYQLTVANAMWGESATTFVPAYLDLLQKTFDAQVNAVDFHNAPAAAAKINDWVAQKTNDRIKNLVAASSINDQTKLILTNAIYFKGDWSEPFKAKMTHDAAWNDGSTPDVNAGAAARASVQMMSQAAGFDYVREDHFAALQMSYRGDDLAMLILLPDEPAGLEDLQKSLDAAHLKQIVGELHHEEVRVSLPTFKLDTKYELSQVLAKMGMPTAFTDRADLSGIDGAHDLSITGVVHKAFVQVDETGTEAAAATGVMVGAMAMRKETIFNADHPFVFVIRDLKTSAILFMGRLAHP